MKRVNDAALVKLWRVKSRQFKNIDDIKDYTDPKRDTALWINNKADISKYFRDLSKWRFEGWSQFDLGAVRNTIWMWSNDFGILLIQINILSNFKINHLKMFLKHEFLQ